MVKAAISLSVAAVAFFLLSMVAATHLAPFSLGGMGVQYRFLATALVAYLTWKRVK